MSRIMTSRVTGIGPTWFDRRQMNFQNPLGTRDYIYGQMYSKILRTGSWDYSSCNTSSSVYGGVFSLEFSPEGSLLVAACEKRSVLVFDPLTHKPLHTIENAHLDCVNCVKFLDSRSFATCSDDFTVALWDARNLNQKVRTLRGHANWVKNIEYSPHDGLLVTSGFDGSILTWEMNKYREEGASFNRVFATNGLMRTRLTPDASKMIICTTGGYLIVIHNLDLDTLSQDLDGFKPNMYRLMQLSQTILPVASDFTHLFRGRGKRNRVEFITDFPEGDDAEVVSSLQIHPDGHSAISRNVSNDEQSEWSCIHNIEERLNSDESDSEDDAKSEDCKTVSWPGSSTSISTTPSYIIQHTVVQNDNNRSGTSRSEAGTSTEHRDLSVSPSDVWEALVAIQDARIRRERDRAAPEIVVRDVFRRQASDAGVQARPLNSGSDNRIFLTRIVPRYTPPSAENREPNRNGISSQSSVPRRNVSVYTTETNGLENGPSSSTSLSNHRTPRRRYRKKIPPLVRFFSLYRRSLVGQYDRTSILRKPMYRNFKVKRLQRIKFDINYEHVGEQQRSQNETERNSQAENFSANQIEDRDQPSGSGIRTQEGHRSLLRRRISTVFRSNLPRIIRPGTTSTQLTQTSSSPINNALNSLREDISSIENNLVSFRETVTSLEGTINSALQVLRRRENILQSINNLNGNENNNVNSNSNSATLAAENAQGTANINAEEDRALRQESARTTALPPIRTIQTPPPRQPTSASAPTSTSTSTSDQNSNERTILMGVFRAGNEGGVRGTTMRRHNIAALTVSSSSSSSSSSNPRISDTLIGGLIRTNRNLPGNGTSGNSLARHYGVPVNKKIHQNVNRLTHYVEEPNLGRGFIKELCISPDGRVICSPFGNGIRLLSFSPSVQDLSYCYPRNPPIALHELVLDMQHSDIVVSTKFSPFHNLLVSGCLSGKIVYYQPSL